MENSFAVTGFVGKDASIHRFTTASIARFSLAISVYTNLKVYHFLIKKCTTPNRLQRYV